jgi:glycosyltransferase involved in cell wall biosynthesis
MFNERTTKLKSKQLKISCIVPVHNEAAGIGLFLDSLVQELATLSNDYEIIVVDDGSTDQSVVAVLPFTTTGTTRLIKLSRNFGKETALSAGLDHCTGDVTIILDADFQHPINVIAEFLQQWVNGYDMVYGVRKNRNDESRLKRWITHYFYLTMSKITKITIVPNAGDFRLLSRNVVEALNQCEERDRFMKGLYAWVGFKSIGVPFEVAARASGKSSWSFKRLAELAITGITSFSNVPLRIWGFAGLAVACFSFAVAIWICVKTLIFGVDVPGYASIMVAIFFFCGVQLLSIGVLGEYIAKIFNEVKRRPKYIIEQKSGF